MDCSRHAHQQRVSIPQCFDYRLADLQLFICSQNGPLLQSQPWAWLNFSKMKCELVQILFLFCKPFYLCFVLNPVFKNAARWTPPPLNFTIKTIVEGQMLV